LMWASAGLFRTREELEAAIRRLDTMYSSQRSLIGAESVQPAAAWRALNLVTVARLIARAALRREESRGAHFRADFPERDDLHWKVHLVDVRRD
jgi:L-aspartate oxidase